MTNSADSDQTAPSGQEQSDLGLHCLFVCLCCVFTAQSTQWGHVERGQFTLPHFYWAGLVLKAVDQYCAHSFARNWQLPFLNQQKGENDRRKNFMIKSPQKNVANLQPPDHQSDVHPTEPPIPASALFVQAILSETLVYKVLRHYLY